jgi:hypothetical protein
MASVEQASAITASSGYKIRYKLTLLTSKRGLFFLMIRDFFRQPYKVSLAKMAAIK